MGISEGQWNVLRSRRAAEAEAITANDSGVSVSAGKVLYGIDGSGCRHLLVPVQGGNGVEEDHESQGVQVGRRSLNFEGVTTVYSDLACLRSRFNTEFGHIVEDVLTSLAAGAASGSVCRNSLEKWRDLLRSEQTRKLDERVAVGLFGELLLLLELVTMSPRSIRLWTGPEGGRFDFSGTDTAIEVKTSTRRYGRLIEISGETQLEAPAGTALFVNFTRLEKVPAGARTLWDLYEEIVRAGVPAREMHRKLEGLDLAGQALRNYPGCYRVLETRLYRVEDGFPKIVPSSFAGGGLPAGTLRLRYMIDLSGEPPMPLDAAATGAVLRKLTQGAADAGSA